MKTQNLQNLMVSISLKKASSGNLLKIGLSQVFRTKADQQRLTDLYATKAADKTPNLDVYRLGRNDLDGKLADGGYLLFTKEGQKMVTPANLPDDLKAFGFHLTVAEIFEKEGDPDHIRLRLTWSRNSSAKMTPLDDRQKKTARRYFDLTYWKIFGFFNPEALSLEGDRSPIQGSIVTLNFSGVINAGHQSEVREVRMTDADGHLACPIIPTACPERTPERFLKAGHSTLHELVQEAFPPSPRR